MMEYTEADLSQNTRMLRLEVAADRASNKLDDIYHTMHGLDQRIKSLELAASQPNPIVAFFSALFGKK